MIQVYCLQLYLRGFVYASNIIFRFSNLIFINNSLGKGSMNLGNHVNYFEFHYKTYIDI